MPIYMNINGNSEPLSLNEKDCKFFLSTKTGIDFQIKTPLKLDSTHKDKNFEVYLLAKKEIKENEIYQVYRKKTDARIGWAIPTIALDSDLHDYKDNPHFLRYAYAGIKEVLKNNSLEINLKTFPNENNYLSISDIFHEETVLLILCKETYGNEYNFNIDRVIPSLIKNGYVKLAERDPSEIKYKFSAKLENKIYLEETASSLDNYSSIADIMNSSFVYEENSIFKFFYIYQIFELLIDHVYKNEQEFLIENLLNVMGDSGKTKESLEKIQNFMSEKKRLGLLIQNYTSINDNLITLRTLCNKLLNMLNRENSENFEGYFYKVRNFLFHQYRDLPKNSIETLEEIVNELVYLLPSILSNYKLPEKI